MATESSVSGSVTQWIVQLKLGNSDAAQELWERYYERLVRLAKKRLAGAQLRATDEEDVVLSAFAAFCDGLDAGRFPNLEDRDDLWRLLVVITARKAIDHLRRETSQKRGGLNLGRNGVPPNSQLDEIVGSEPSPDFAAETADTYRALMAALPVDSLRTVAQTKMQGYTNEEVASRIGCSLRTVERRLRLIRELWQHEMDAR